MAEKNMIIALVLSFIWSGLGLIYAGEMTMGVLLAVLAVVFELLSRFILNMAGIIVFIIWAYSMYATYRQVKEANGE